MLKDSFGPLTKTEEQSIREASLSELLLLSFELFSEVLINKFGFSLASLPYITSGPGDRMGPLPLAWIH